MSQSPVRRQTSAIQKPLSLMAGSGVQTSSRSASVWQGFAVEHWRLPPTEAPETILQQHHVAVQLSPPLLLEWKQNGRFVQSQLLPDDISLVSCGETGAFRWREGEAELVVCTLEPEFLHSVLPDTVKRREIEFQSLKGRQDAQVASLLCCLKAEVENGYAGGRLFGEHLACALALILLRKYAAYKSDLPSFAATLDRNDLRIALEYIHDNLGSDLGLQEIAQAASLSVSRFSRLFKQATGQAPHSYVVQARIARAQTLLRHSELSLSQIAAEVGFYDPAHFARHFKRLTGMTPQQMRMEKRSVGLQSTSYPRV